MIGGKNMEALGKVLGTFIKVSGAIIGLIIAGFIILTLALILA